MAKYTEAKAYKALERLVKARVYTMGSSEAVAMLKDAAYDLGLDYGRDVDLEQVRKILGRGTPMAQIIREMRESE